MPDSFKNLVAGRFQKSPLANQIRSSLVIEYANETIRQFWGKKGAEQAKAVSLKRQIIKIVCQNSIIAQELNFKKTKIIELVNQKFLADTVKKLQIVQKGIEKDPV
ncbi:DUF721 domain-containing protein [Candidatus Kuenenbacteria bacterium]|nr:DUF721 domain-containing protein [Candidatus Kuenenbacteria bacterium]